MKLKDIPTIRYMVLKTISFYTKTSKLKDISDRYNYNIDIISYDVYHSYDARMSIHPDMYETIVKNFRKVNMTDTYIGHNYRIDMHVLSILSGD